MSSTSTMLEVTDIKEYYEDFGDSNYEEAMHALLVKFVDVIKGQDVTKFTIKFAHVWEPETKKKMVAIRFCSRPASPTVKLDDSAEKKINLETNPFSEN